MIYAAAVVAFLSLLAFWKYNAALFMLAAGSSMMVGLQWYDTYDTHTGLTIGLMLIAYALVCIAFAFKCIFWKQKQINEEDGG